MGTSAGIFLKIRNKDKGKTIKCNIKKLPNPLHEYIYPCEEYQIKKYEGDLYLGIYVHFDGYPDGVGQELLNKFKTYEDVLNLISLGSCSCIWDEIISYKNWRNEDLKILCHEDNLDNISGYSYIYIFEDDKWRQK